MKDIELPPLPRRSLCEFDGAVEIDLYTKEQMQSYARAAVESDRAQRVPDGWANLLKAAREVLSWTQAADRPPVRDKYECGRMTGVRVHALADLHEAVQALASTPAQPAQPVERKPLGYVPISAIEEVALDGYLPVYKDHGIRE